MNKSIKAFLMGYLFFKVNNKYFLTYNKALNYRKIINGDINFQGWNPLHLFNKSYFGHTFGWVGFYYKIINLLNKKDE